jgi:hypothetical protein
MSADQDVKRDEVATWVLSRRVLMGTAAAVSAVSLLPLPASLAAVGTIEARLLTDWTIDDMWGVYPRYAEPIAYGRPWADGDVAVDAVDLQFST